MIFVLLLSAETAFAEKEEYDFTKMTTYEMFWPIVAGKVPGDRFYNLKLWRDKLVSYLFFSQVKKSEYFKQLANKRLVEAERLLELQRYSFFPETIADSSRNLKEGVILLSSAEETPQMAWLKGEYVKDLQKHLVVLQRMKEKVKEDQKQVIEETIETIENLIKEYKLEK